MYIYIYIDISIDISIDIEISKSTTPHNFYSIYRLLLKNCRNVKMANKGRNM